MKGINLNGTIKTYNSVPKTWGNILGVNYMSDEDLEGLGFYDVVRPSTKQSEQLGDIFFDADAEVFTYPVESRTYTQTVAELKERIRQGKIIALGDRRGEVQILQMKTIAASEIELDKTITEAKLETSRSYYDKLDKMAKLSGLSRKEVEEELSRSSFDIANKTLSLIGGINELFNAENEAQSKRNFQIDKAVKIAQATTSGIQATINAFATASKSPITIGFPAYPFVQAGLAGSFAAVNIAKIAKTKFGGGGSPDLDTGGGGGAGGGSMPQPSFNVVGDSGINQLAELQMQPTQAFVVSGDITTAQSLDRNKIQNATI